MKKLFITLIALTTLFACKKEKDWTTSITGVYSDSNLDKATIVRQDNTTFTLTPDGGEAISNIKMSSANNFAGSGTLPDDINTYSGGGDEYTNQKYTINGSISSSIITLTYKLNFHYKSYYINNGVKVVTTDKDDSDSYTYTGSKI